MWLCKSCPTYRKVRNAPSNESVRITTTLAVKTVFTSAPEVFGIGIHTIARLLLQLSSSTLRTNVKHKRSLLVQTNAARPHVSQSSRPQTNGRTWNNSTVNLLTGFPLYFGIKIQGLSRTLKLHFQAPILDGSLQHGQY